MNYEVKEGRMKNLKLGIQPFWFWNGDMQPDEIQRQIREMHDKGLSGFLIHPRQGMEIPYLSESFFDRVKLAVDTAASLDMEVWLYDEFPYPSGVGAGTVTVDHPEFLCTCLQKNSGIFPENTECRIAAPWGKVLLAAAYPTNGTQTRWDRPLDLSSAVGVSYGENIFQLSGMTKYTRKRFFQGIQQQEILTRLPATGIQGFSSWKVYLVTQGVMRHFKYFETFVDPLQKEAVQCFLKNVHERYKAHVGYAFGKTIKGFFSDEVTAFPPELPWSRILPDLVKERHGIDLTAGLPALFEDMGPDTEKVRYAWRETCCHAFMESYDRQVADWCHQNGLLYIGEKPILRSEELSLVDIPGIDTGHTKADELQDLFPVSYRANPKIASSAAHFYHKPAALCESFHSIGWSMTIQDMKTIYDYLTALGVGFHVTHAAYYTTDSLRKHDAPPSMFYQMPWWRDSGTLSELVKCEDAYLTGTERTVDCLVMDPIESIWASTIEEEETKKQKFAEVGRALLAAHLDFYVIDPHLFSDARIERQDGKTVLVIENESFHVLVLPYMTALDGQAADKLWEFIQAGGCAVFAGAVPRREIDGSIPENLKNLFSDHSGEMSFNRSYYTDNICEMVSKVRENAPDPVQITVQPEDTGFLVVRGQDPCGKDRIFAANVGAQKRDVTISLHGRVYKKTFCPLESMFLSEEDAEKTPEKKVHVLPLDGKWRIETERKNILRFGDALLETADGQRTRAGLYPAVNEYMDAGVRISVQTAPYFGCPYELSFPAFHNSYTMTFDCSLPTSEMEEILFVTEPGTFSGNVQIDVNGKIIPSDAFRIQEVYLPSNCCALIGPYLKNGRNRITIQVQGTRPEDGIRNPLYLAGNFAVYGSTDGIPCLQPRKTEGMIGDLVSCGLPYYAGTIHYFRKMNASCLVGENPGKEDSIPITLPEWVSDAVHLFVNGEEIGTCTFSPYRFLLPKKILKEENEIRIDWDTTMIGLFEGQYYDPVHKCNRDILLGGEE